MQQFPCLPPSHIHFLLQKRKSDVNRKGGYLKVLFAICFLINKRMDEKTNKIWIPAFLSSLPYRSYLLYPGTEHEKKQRVYKKYCYKKHFPSLTKR